MRAKSTARGCYPNELTVGFFSFPEKEINDITKLFDDHVSGERSLVSAAVSETHWQPSAGNILDVVLRILD